ncbi:hypothetical protein CKO20_03245 [Rhodocyclus tenuis]|nr:hypothetical protein [Rhodocyclus tenuis]
MDLWGGAVAQPSKPALSTLKLRASTLVLATCLGFAAPSYMAHAAGLGKVNVFSALGQPLRAEVELSATREELSGMKAQLASQDAFKQAGLDYATTLLGIKFVIDKRPNGQQVIKLSTERPVNDPFIDLLLELNWPAGRLVREYTFLLDPPELAAAATPAPVVPAVTRPAESTLAATPAARRSPKVAAAPAPALEKPAPAAKKPAPAPAVRAETPAPAATGDTREIKQGETLRRIASETKPEGVSLEQMLVGLFRSNPDAFDGNMNRMRAGRILNLPDAEGVAALPDAEAKEIVVAQSADWNAYRRKLAGLAAQSTAKDDSGRQETGGRITAKVEDKAAPAAPKDRVKVSKAEASGGRSVAAEEEIIARERALKEANERVASLEKNVNDLQKLVELKNQSLADLQKQAAAKAAAPAAAPVEAKKPEAEAKPAVKPEAKPETKAEPAPLAAADKPLDVPKPESATSAGDAKPELKVEEKPAEPPPAAEAPKPRPKPVIPPLEEEPEEESFFSELLGNPMATTGGGGIAVLLGLYLLYKRRQRAAAEEAAPAAAAPVTLSQQSGGLTANSVFRATGGQSVDTSNTPAQTDFSQAGPGSIDTDEVDPVAEADVYMAYGRDAQAEEILLEAKQKDPKRHAIHLKLLEIYANRKNVKQFETLATELYGETAGLGADWEKAAAMGARLDPQNPLFGNAAQAAAGAAAPVVPAQRVKDTLMMPGRLAQMATEASAANAAPLLEPLIAVPALRLDDAPAAGKDEATQVVAASAASEPFAEPALDFSSDFATDTAAKPSEDAMSLDFDLGLGDTALSAAPLAEPAPTAAEEELEIGALDFDLAAPLSTNETLVAQAPAASVEDALEIDFELSEPVPETTTAETAALDQALDFDFGLASETGATAPAPAETAPAAASKAVVEAKESKPIEPDESALEFDVHLTESTVLGQPMASPSFDMSSISLDLDEPPLELAAEPAATPAPSEPAIDRFEVDTLVNADFLSSQVETVVNPQFASEAPDLDLAPEIDLSSEVPPGSDEPASEEAATKLDLAKAYEEMGDLEGARELLQEVLGEGNAEQRETATTILARIAG